MSQATKEKITNLAVYEDGKVVILDSREEVKSAIVSFIDSIVTATGRSTFYNSKKDQDEALEKIHNAVFGINRGLYSVMLMLPGVTDLSVQKGILNLLGTSYPWEDTTSFLTLKQENQAIRELASTLPITRLFKLLIFIKDNKINNSRSRRLIFDSILANSRLGFWSVKYRNKLRIALTHAWGQKKTSAIRSILSKKSRTVPEKSFIFKAVDKYTGRTNEGVRESVCFILGGEKENWTNKLIKAFYDARIDLKKGKGLPPEVLEGIRGRYHKNTIVKDALEISKEVMSVTQKMAVQRSSKRAGVKIDFDPTKQDMVKLYVYAIEEGINKKIRDALDMKAKKVATTFPMKYDHIGIVLDNSASMYGSDSQKHRPIAIALSMKDILKAGAKNTTIVTTNDDLEKHGITKASGSTSLASALVDVIEKDPDVIYMITDGYENAPAGRVNEVVNALRDLGIETPVFQVSPVMSTESAGIRSLSDEIEALPVAKPEGIGLSMVRAIINQGDLEQGIAGLLGTVTNRLENKNG